MRIDTDLKRIEIYFLNYNLRSVLDYHLGTEKERSSCSGTETICTYRG